MKHLLFFCLFSLLAGFALAQTPMLHNNDVCIQVVGSDMVLAVVGDVEQVSPNRPGIQNTLGGELGASLQVTGDISVLPGGADLLKTGNEMFVWLVGQNQHLSGADATFETGFLNFTSLLVGGTADKTFTGDIKLNGAIGFSENVNLLSQGYAIIAQDEVLTDPGIGLLTGFLPERELARYKDDDGFIGRFNYDSEATPGYFATEQNIGGAGFLLRQPDLINFSLDRFHQPVLVAPGLESLPLRYVFDGDVTSPADIGIRYNLVGTSTIDVNDLTIWYRQGGDWINLGADEVSSTTVRKNDVDGALLAAGVEFVTAPCPAPLVSLNVPVESTLCQFETNTLEVVDPSGDFTYAWSTGETTRTVDIIPTDLTPLEYSVTVTDATKCFRTFDIPLAVLPTPGVDIDPAVTTADTVTLCQDADLLLDPTVVFTDMDNPDAGYIVEYLWSTGETTETITLTGDGSNLVDTITLSVRITNFAGSAAGCERTDTLYVRNQALPGFDLGPDRNFCDGTTATTLTTGIADPSGLSIVWTRPDETTFMGPELNASQSGFYTVAVNNGECTVMDGLTVNFSNLSGTGMAVGPDCHPDNTDPGASQSGTLEISLSGGIAPFSWFIEDLGLNGQSGVPDFIISSTFPEPDIEANTDHFVEVIDGAGCTIIIGPLRFTPPVALAITPVIQDDLCGAGEGSISLTTIGGTPPYTYNWSNGASGVNVAAITNLTAGDYAVTVTDVNFCQQFFTGLTVGGSASGQPLSLAADFMPVNCPGETTTVTLAATGGNPGYTYSENGTDFNDVTTYELGAGSYVFVVRDAEGCEVTRPITINDGNGPEVPTVSILSPLQCFGDLTDVALNTDPQQQDPTEYSLDNVDYTFSTTFTGLPAGDYRLYARNIQGCVDSLDFTIDGPEELVVDALTITDDVCGLGEGAIDLTVAGGTGDLSYAWDIPAMDCCPSNLFAGSYTVTVTDENGCTLEETFTVGGAAGAMEVVGSGATDPTCSDVADGTISVTLTGGTPPYRYALNGAAPQPFTGDELLLDNLAAGAYNLVLLDANGCTTTASQTLIAPAPIVITLESTLPSGCADEPVGGIDLTITGPQDLSILWDDGPTTADRSNLSAGDYTVTAFRAGFPDCSATLTVTVEQLPPVGLSFTVSPDLCLDGGGSIAVSATGGTGLVAYDWSDGATGPNRTDLPAGDYGVTVTDENNCTDEAVITVTGPDLPLALASTVTDVTCFGAGDGSVAVAPSGGTGTYTYAWSTGSGEATITDLEPGAYTVTVSDEAGCLVEETFTVASPAALAATAVVTAVDITGTATGAIDVTVSGGTTPYDYFWDVAGTPFSTDEDLTNLPAGVYNLVVVDANGCTLDRTYVVSEPSALAIVIEEEESIACFGGDNGVLLAEVEGGDGNYSYSWQLNGEEFETTQEVTDLLVGVYVLTVTDGLGNTASLAYELTEPEELVVTPARTNPSCSDLADGGIDLTVSGGTGQYDYAWEDGAATPNREFLPPGTYMVTVTDENGCSTSPAPITLTAPAALALMATVENISAPGATDGSIDLTVNGGMPGYNYVWDNGATTEDLANLAPGDYVVTVTDANACVAEAAFTVGGSGALAVSVDVTAVTCVGGGDGAIQLTIAGGDGDYTITWADGPTGASRTGLPAGDYTVTVTDPAAADFTATYTVADGSPVDFDLTVLDIDCAGNVNGSIVWSSGANGETLTGLAAGPYSVTITNDAGCQLVVDTVIREPETLQLAASTTPVSTEGGSDGSVDLMVSGGTEPYAYAWSPGGQTTEDLGGLSAGVYTVTVTDARFCSDELSVTVEEPGAILLSGEVTDVRCNGESNGTIELTATGGQGFLSFAWSDGSDDEDREDLPAGTYRVVVTDLTGRQDSIDFTVTEPDPLLANESLTPPACAGDANGIISLAPTGGNGGYNFAWEDGSTESSRTGLAAGDYPVTIMDAAGCVLIRTITLTEPEAISLAFALEQPGCGAGDPGSIDLTVSGGTPNYAFAWATGQISEDLAGVAAGEYTVTVTDANGCTADSTVMLDPAGAFSLSAVVEDPLCSGTATGTISLTVDPPADDLTFAWSNGQSTAVASGLIAGDYGVTVTSADGCSADSVFTITAPEALVANVNTTAAGCRPDEGGGALVIAEGGTPGYTYAWSTGAATAMVDGLAAGSYTVTVTDDNGCTTTATASIMEADADLEVRFLAATPVDAEQQIQFVDVSFPAPQAWFWEFNDPAGTTSTEPNPVFAYPNDEVEDMVVYPAALTASSLFCQDVLVKDITVISLNRRDEPIDAGQRPVYANLEDVVLYPNPAADFAAITVTLNLAADITVSVVDGAGRVLRTQELSGADRYDWVVDVQGLPAGMYFVRVETQFGVRTRKLVVD